MALQFSAEDLAAIQEIASEDSDPAFSGPTGGGKKQFPRRPHYKLMNPTPDGPALPMPGFKLSTFNEGTGVWEEEKVPELKGVILYASDTRTFKKGAKGEIACQSFNGEQAAPKIVAPPCRKLDTQGVAAVLSNFRGMDKAKIDERVAQLVDGQGKLSFCAIKTKTGGFIPLCPMARYNEDTGQAGPCKPGITLVMWDIKRERVFKMDIGGRSISDSQKKGVSEYQEFRKMLGEKRVPAYAFVVTLTPKGETNQDGTASKFYTLGLTASPISRPENRKAMGEKAIVVRDAYIKSANWVPKETQPVIKPPPVVKVAEITPPGPAAEDLPASFADDDIDF